MELQNDGMIARDYRACRFSHPVMMAESGLVTDETVFGVLTLLWGNHN